MKLERILICGFLFVGGAIFSYQGDFGILGLIAVLLGGIPLVAYWWKSFGPIIMPEPDNKHKEDNHEDP